MYYKLIRNSLHPHLPCVCLSFFLCHPAKQILITFNYNSEKFTFKLKRWARLSLHLANQLQEEMKEPI